jgi:transposase
MRETPVIASAPVMGSTTRRCYGQDLKRQVVEASFLPGAPAAQVARQHGLNGNLLHNWRWHYRRGLLGVANQDSALPPSEGLIPVHVSADAPANVLAT